MQEKSKEQGNGQKRGYNLLDKEEQKSMLSCFVEQLCDPLIFIFVCGCGNIPAAAGIWRYVHYTCSSTVKCRGRSDPGGKGETGVRGVGKNDKPACPDP